MAGEKAFEVDSNGILIESGTLILSGLAAPTAISMNVPCFYFRTNGEIYSHTGIGTWTLFSSGGGSSFDENKILLDNQGRTLNDQKFNLLRSA